MAAIAALVVPSSATATTTESYFPTGASPQTRVDPDPNGVELGLKFRVATPGTVTGVKYYGTPSNTGPHTGSLWSGTGQRLATATFADTGQRGWQTVSFAHGVHIVPGRDYVASYLAPSGHYAASEWGFDSPGASGDITTAASAGVYHYGNAGGFPTDTWHNSNYFVDIAFSPDAASENSGSVSASQTPTPTPSTAPTSTPTRTTTPTPTPAPSTTAASKPQGACGSSPGSCGYPDASTTGVQSGVSLTPMGSVTITTPGTTFQNALVNGTIDVEANNVTIRNVRVVQTGNTWGIGLMHASGTTIDHVQVMRGNGDRLQAGIKDVYGDDTGTTITHADISGTDTGIFMHEGLLQDSYIHDLAMDPGDHVNGITSNGATTPMTINHNTIYDQLDQTDAIGLFEDFGQEANRTITNNLLAGGDYALYAGSGSKGTTHNIVVTGNRFARVFYPNSGQYGPVTSYDTNGSGNIWSNNTWDDTGAPVNP